MESNKFPPIHKLEILFLSWFGLGFAKKAPGTIGSLGAIPLLMLLGKIKIHLLFLLPIFILAIVGTSVVIDFVQKKYGGHDEGWIVIDEVYGMLLTWAFFPVSTPLNLLLVFVFFRIFDIFKPWPISFIDKKLHNGLGVLLDDLIAAIFAGICVYVCNLFIPLILALFQS